MKVRRAQTNKLSAQLMISKQEIELRKFGLISRAQLYASPENLFGIEIRQTRGPHTFNGELAYLRVEVSRLQRKIRLGRLLAMKMQITALAKAKRACYEVAQIKHAKIQAAMSELATISGHIHFLKFGLGDIQRSVRNAEFPGFGTTDARSL